MSFFKPEFRVLPGQISQSQIIKLRGVRVHNLQNIDLDIPHGQLLAICGLSGSGKTSLALDTLYAEGGRRYIESFSPYTRQFLDQLEKPDADRIEGIPPAIAVVASRSRGSNRTTVGTVTETIDYLRLLFAKISTVVCPECQTKVQSESAQSVSEMLSQLPNDKRFQITFPIHWDESPDLKQRLQDVRRDGFRRTIFGNSTLDLDSSLDTIAENSSGCPIWCVVDRLKTGDLHSGRHHARCVDSLETAFKFGHGHITVFVELEQDDAHERHDIDDREFSVFRYSNRQICTKCGRQFLDPEPSSFSFNSPHGACAKCEGFGNIQHLDINKIVPDDSKTVREGAIAPWNSSAYRHELDELIELADDYQFPLDIPFNQLAPEHIDLLWKGVPERQFGGLDGFFNWLARRKYKMHLRVFLSRWRSLELCRSCSGRRLNETALSYQVAGNDISELSRMPIEKLVDLLGNAEALTTNERKIATTITGQLMERLAYLCDVGVGYLSLDRAIQTLSGGERQRVALTRALGSSLVNLLYVLDEPSAGLHAKDIEKIRPQIDKLQKRNNTVVMVEHNAAILRASERIIEIGPGAGTRGGEIVFDGTPAEIELEPDSITGQFLSGRRGFSFSERRRPASRGKINLIGARGNNLKNLSVEFPLGLLCVVTGVSGSGKSSLVQQTLGRALLRDVGKENVRPLEYDDLHGVGKIRDVVLIDQSTIQKSSRSNPVTYVKAFDEIRKVFAGTVDAKTRNLRPGHFSFNVEGGRCENCHGEGYLTIDMQFMADVLKRCDHCQGTRFKPEIREVHYRSKNIADVLEMTVTTAFSFFRGHRKVQSKLKLLKDVGLDYVQLGQPLSTLSAGEAQRLKLASFLGGSSKKRTLFIMDEPTTGLHMADVVRLVDCFDSLIDVGHSMIVVEHNLQLVLHADYVIDLGPGAAEQGGQVVATGTPEQISENPNSETGKYLRQVFAEVVG